MKNFFRLSELIHFEIIKDVNIRFSQHDDVEVLYVLNGDVKVSINSVERLMCADELLVINSGEVHSYISQSKSCVVICMMLDRTILCELLDVSEVRFMNRIAYQSIIHEENLRTALRLMLQEYHDQKTEESLEFYSHFFRMLSALKKGFLVSEETKKETNIPKSNKKEYYRSRIKKYISDNCENQITLQHMSEYLELSETYTSKLFHALFNMGFPKYINNYRVEKAKKELEKTDKSILEIAIQRGFSSAQSFNKAFMEKYKMLPAEYRRKHKSKIKDSKTAGNFKWESLDGCFTHNVSNADGFKRENIFFNYTDETKYTLNRIWEKMLTVKHASELLSVNVQNQLLDLKENLGFNYVRISKIISDRNLRIGAEERDEYNFSVMGMIIDFLLRNRFKPYFCFGQNELSLNDSEINIRFLSEFMQFIVRRYGKEEVENWYIELKMDENQSYVSFYETALSKIKEFNEQIRVGCFGAEINGSNDINNLLFSFKEKRIYPDFVSLYIFQYVKDCSGKYQIRSNEDDYLKKVILNIKGSLNQLGYSAVPIVISEWNATDSDRSLSNDGCNRAAYICKNFIEISDADGTDAIVYSNSLDLSAESDDTIRIINGVRGLVSKHGIKKPAYYAFELLHSLGKNVMGKGKNYIVTKDMTGNIIMLLYNYKEYKTEYFKDNIESTVHSPDDPVLFKESSEVDYSVLINALPYGQYKVRQISVNTHNGSVYNEWEKMNFISNPTYGELDFLQKTCIPSGMLMQRYIVTDGKLRLNIRLEPFEISQIIISKYR